MSSKDCIFLAILWFSLGLSISALARADEEILSFIGEARVEEVSKSMVVTEVIQFRCEGTKIKYGLIRSLPKAIPAGGKQVPMQYELLHSFARLVDSQNQPPDTVPVALKETSDHYQFYIGQEAKHLPIGIHEFTLQYRIKGAIQIGDELETVSWHISGSWPFPIRKVAARFYPPSRLLTKNIGARAWDTKVSSGWFGSQTKTIQEIRPIISTDQAEKNSLGEAKPVVSVNLSDEQGEPSTLVLQVQWPKDF